MLMRTSNLNQFFTRDEVRSQFEPDTWQRKVFSELDTTLTSDSRPFPCIYGVAGHKAGQIRYAFAEVLSADRVAATLESYLGKSREFGANTSMVMFEAPTPLMSVEGYYERFWNLLKNVVALDTRPWPADVPEETDARMWEFCFAGEPVFVVCNTPAHILRQSRRSSTFMLTFQPRWVFDRILGTEKAATRAFGAVRERLEKYDFVERSPSLGKYGDPNIREAEQYFLDDHNTPLSCPFHKLKD